MEKKVDEFHWETSSPSFLFESKQIASSVGWGSSRAPHTLCRYNFFSCCDVSELRERERENEKKNKKIVVATCEQDSKTSFHTYIYTTSNDDDDEIYIFMFDRAEQEQHTIY